MKLSIVVPCYNEAENIPLILNRFSEVVTDDMEVVLVNNGSTDNSAQIFDELLPLHSFARMVHVPVNQGYGYGILQGLKSCESDYVGWTHADMQTDPNDVVKAWKTVKENKGKQVYVKGNRKGRPFADTFFTWGMGVFETIYMGEKMNDINAQPNIFPKKFYDTWQNPPHDFALDLYAAYMAKKQNIEVIRFPVLFPERIHGESKWNTGLKAKWKFIKRTIDFSIKLKKQGVK